jgi:signal transduction histidine kinase/CheY-like chemotaxis protein
MNSRALQKLRRTYELLISSLRWRLLWISMLPLILFALIWMSYALVQRYADLSSQLEQRAQLLARQMAVASDYAIFAQNNLVLQNITASVVKEPEVSFAGVYDASLQALSISERQTDLSKERSANLSTQMSAVTNSGLPFMSIESDRLVRFIQPINSIGLDLEDTLKNASKLSPITGYAVVEVSIDSVYTELIKFLFGVLLILAALLYIALLVVNRFSSQLENSFRLVANAAKKIGAGDTKVRLRLGSNDIKVFDQLSYDINIMAERLDFSQNYLENKVLTATQALREQKEAAEISNNAKSRFLAAASHDLRQPIHAISLLVSAAQFEKDPAAQSAIIGRIENGTAALSDLLNSLLDISRLDGGGVQIHEEDFALDKVMNNLQNTYQSLAEEKGLDLIIRPTKACTRSDPMLLERILSNLVSNAVRYTPPGGVVYVAVRPRGQEWLVQVRDNGPGISPEEQDNIFQEFVQLSNPQRDRSQGLGLGLAIVKRLIHLLSHRVAVRSALAQGATFSIYIPKIELGQHTTQTTTDTFKASKDPSSQLKGLRILVIEDDELVRQSFQGLLAMWGASVDVFEQAELAIQHATQPDHRPDLIITDHRLGGLHNGLELSREIAQLLSHPIPTLLITGDTEDLSLQRISDKHIQVLYKPVKPNVLIGTIHNLIVPPDPKAG